MKEEEHGFTLTELMIVIAIMGILMSISVPAFSNWAQNYRLKAAAREIYSILQRARLEAIKTNANTVVTFNAGTGICELRGAGGVLVQQIVIPNQVRIAAATFLGNPPQTGFTSKALPLGIGNVQLANANNRWYRITLNIAGGVNLQAGVDNDGDGLPDDWI